MPDSEVIKALNRIEDALSRDRPETSYREAILATMYRKKFTLADAQEIVKTKKVMFNLADNNQTLSLKNRLKIYDVNLFVDDDTVRYIIENIDSDDPMPMLNEEIRKMIIDSKALMKEITEAYNKLENPKLSDSILTLFSEADRKQAKKLYRNSYWCYQFIFSSDIEFKRKDGSEFSFRVEFAYSAKESSIGLSKRPFLKKDSGMWYDEGSDKILRYITTDVPAPLSVAYIRSDHIITEIVDRKANDPKAYSNKVPSQYVLEVPQGWFKENNIQVGDRAEAMSLVWKKELV